MNERELENYETMQARQEMRAPHCEKCGNAIYSDFLWHIGRDILCEDCAEKMYKRPTEQYEKEDI